MALSLPGKRVQALFVKGGRKGELRAEPEARSCAGVSDHGSVVRHDPFAFQVAHRRLAWMFRLSVGFNVALCLCLCLLAVTITELLPLKELRLALVRMDPRDERLVRIEPIDVSIEGFDKLLEQVSARVVRLLLEVDEISQESRNRSVRPYLSDQFAKQFANERLDEVEAQIRDGLNRSIVIESSEINLREGNEWRVTVDFMQIDAIGGQTSRRPLRAYLRVTTVQQEVTPALEYENPLGVQVLDMVVKFRRSELSVNEGGTP